MKLIIISLLAAICMMSSTYALDNIVDIKMIRTADMAEVDTVYIGSRHHFQILIENAWIMGGMSLAFQVYSEDGVTWNWDSQPSGLPEDGLKAVTIVPGSRMDNTPWDMTGHDVTETNMDGVGSDSLIMGGVALMIGLVPGPLEPSYEMHFTPIDMSSEDIDMICIDSAFIPPHGVFSFADNTGMLITIQFDGPYCWPVKRFVIGDFDMDGAITVGDAVEIIQFIFLGKPNKGPIEAGDVNCDGLTDVADAVYLINYIFRFGPPLGCL